MVFTFGRKNSGIASNDALSSRVGEAERNPMLKTKFERKVKENKAEYKA
jgi:hypothetical protein